MQDESTSCWWHGGHADYEKYHDTEWGRPVKKDQRLYEKICLEGFQSGLSWLTILRKRDNFRAGFAKFDFRKVAEFDEADVERLVQDAGIVRHRGKINSTINNARRACEMIEAEGSLATFFWRYEPDPASRPKKVTKDTIAAKTPESIAMSKELKKRGWSFVGPTTAFAFMQSMGMVNDHLDGCPMRAPCEAERQAFKRPG